MLKVQDQYVELSRLRVDTVVQKQTETTLLAFNVFIYIYIYIFISPSSSKAETIIKQNLTKEY